MPPHPRASRNDELHGDLVGGILNVWVPAEEVREASQHMYEITEEMLEDRNRSPFSTHMHEFCRRWLEANCDPEDLDLMKAINAHLWGPGIAFTETDLLTTSLGRTPSRDEVEVLIDRGLEVMKPCFEAWHQSAEHRALQKIHYGREL